MNEKRYKIRSRKWCKIRPGKLCKRKQTQSISAMNSQSSINWVKLLQSLAENCCKVWRKCCRNQPRKVRPEMLQKSAEKGSEIGREKFGRKRSAAKGRPQKVGRKRLAAKLLQIQPGHSCDQFLPAMNSESSINWVQLRNLNRTLFNRSAVL